MLSSSLAPIPLGDLDMGDSYPDVIWSQACPSVSPTVSPVAYQAIGLPLLLAPVALVLVSVRASGLLDRG